MKLLNNHKTQGKSFLLAQRTVPIAVPQLIHSPWTGKYAGISMTGIAGDAQLVHAVKVSASARAPSSRTPGLHYRSGWFWCTGGSENTALLRLWRRPTSPNTLLLTCISGSEKCAPQNWCPRAFSLADLVALFKLTKVFFDISQRYDKKPNHVLY